MRRSVVVVAALLVLAFVLVGVPSLLTSPTTSSVLPEQEPNTEAEIVRPTGGESGFWPYINSRQSFQKRSPINVVIIGETDTVVRLLTEGGDVNWEETDETEQGSDSETFAIDVDNESDSSDDASENVTIGTTEVTWSRTTGAIRYAYVDSGDGSGGQWVRETAQIHDGDYYGYRYHSRLYESPREDESWVAIQTHSEHFDWFTLRHRVHGSQAAQTRLEADLLSLPQVDVRKDVSRVYLGNGNASDGDGWATYVDLLGISMFGLLAIAFPSTFGLRNRLASSLESRLTTNDRRRIAEFRERIDVRHFILIGTIIAIVLGVRIGGIAMERMGILSMHGIAAALYPFIALGLPIGTTAIASGLERRLDAAVVAGGSFAAAIWLDYGTLGVTTLPVDVVVQRMLLVVVLGLIAGGAVQRGRRQLRENSMLLGGTILWLVLVGGTLFGYF
ncbi:MAG: hypothetical protein ACOCY7_04065 [Halodesulfurarchaeum sp.]